jgi:hypothetical protein
MEIRFFLLLRWKFPQLYNTIYQKRLLRPKSHTGTFSALTMDLGTFSQLTVDFSPVETGIFGRLVLIPFHGYAGNPTNFSYDTTWMKYGETEGARCWTSKAAPLYTLEPKHYFIYLRKCEVLLGLGASIPFPFR